jgi:hypothetical protein
MFQPTGNRTNSRQCSSQLETEFLTKEYWYYTTKPFSKSFANGSARELVIYHQIPSGYAWLY